MLIGHSNSTGVAVGLESVWYRAIEGEAVEVCASVKQPANIDCPINFEFSLVLSTADDSAGIFLLTILKTQSFQVVSYWPVLHIIVAD